jgi:Polyketide cyclase / dehydrase and lipid transport
MGGWIAVSTAAGVGAAIAGGYLGVVTGALAIDLGVGRRTRALGPHTVEIGAPREEVFDVIAAGYLARQPKAAAAKIRVLERGTDMVLASHRTPVRGRLVATTLETVRFTRPERVDFRLVRGPVPHVVERFTLTATETGTTLNYQGELAADLWRLGQLWGDLVADRWEGAVATSLEVIKTEAEHRASLDARTRRP